jgi:hypothetical protein
MSEKNGLEIFACWIALVQAGSLCETRGDLSKYDIPDLSRLTLITEKILNNAITYLSQTLDWIEVIGNLDKNVNECQNRVTPNCDSSSMLCNTIQCNSNININSIKDEFNKFRLMYPGTKRGLDTEFKDFSKHTDFKESAQKLLPSLNSQIEWRKEMKAAGMFVPEWKHLKTWLHQRCWENEKPKIETRKKRFGRQEITNQELREQMDRVKLT